MRFALLIGILFISAETFSQEVWVVPVRPLKKIPYLQFKDSLSAEELINRIIHQGQWKGQVIDSVNDFVIYQLPVDRMKCLVPSGNNPAMTSKMVVPMQKPDAAPIPNAIQPNR